MCLYTVQILLGWSTKLMYFTTIISSISFFSFWGSLSHSSSSTGTSARLTSVVARLYVNGRQDLAHTLEERRYEQVCQAPPHHLHRRQQHHEALQQRHHQPAGGGSRESASEEQRTVRNHALLFLTCSFIILHLKSCTISKKKKKKA